MHVPDLPTRQEGAEGVQQIFLCSETLTEGSTPPEILVAWFGRFCSSWRCRREARY
jgi:hypothetical protein